MMAIQQKGFTEPILAEEKASLTHKSSCRRQNVTYAGQFKWRSYKYIGQTKGGKGSSVFSLHGGNWLISNTLTLKNSGGKCFEEEEQFWLLAGWAASRWGPWQDLASLSLHFKRAQGQKSTARQENLVLWGWWCKTILVGLSSKLEQCLGHHLDPAAPGSPSDFTYTWERCPGSRG